MKKLKTVILTTIMIVLISSLSLAGINDGLVAHYPFDGNANDASGNGNNGTVHGATLIGDRFGNANSFYSFDGWDDYINCGNSPLFDVNHHSIIAWIKILGGNLRNSSYDTVIIGKVNPFVHETINLIRP